jgi:hypothetical protein
MRSPDHTATPTGAKELQAPCVLLGLGDSLPAVLIPGDWTVQYVVRPELAPIPNVRPWLRGAYVDRGQIVPVFDLRCWLDAERIDPTRAIAVLSRGDHRLGLAVAEEPRIATQLKPRPAGSPPDAVPEALAAHLDLWSHTEHGPAARFDPWAWAQSQAGQVVALS